MKKPIAVLVFAILALASIKAGTYSTEIGYELNDSSQQATASVDIGPFYVPTTLVGLQLSVSMAATPSEALQNGFAEALIKVIVNGQAGATGLQIGSGPTGDFHGNYGGTSVANTILKAWYSSSERQVNQTVYIPLSGLPICGGATSTITVYIGTSGVASDVEVQGSLQFCQ